MNIPFFRLDRQFEYLRASVLTETEAILKTGKVLQGPRIAELETRLADMFNLTHAATVASGTDALIFSLRALGICPGDKIAVTSLSFIASASAIVQAGGIPIFVDIDINTYMASKIQLLELIKTKAVKGIIAVHLYGQMMDLEEIYNEAKKRGIFVIEDAAQALGATKDSHMPGLFSDAVTLSFDPTKVVGAYGSGGAILTNNTELNDIVQKLRYHGHEGNRVYKIVGYNSQLHELQAGFILLKLNYLEDWQKKRLDIAEKYNNTLKWIKGITSPIIAPGNTHIFHKYVINAGSRRDQISSFLKENGIATTIHYRIPLHMQPVFKHFQKHQRPLPVVEDITQRILSLPIYPELTTPEIDYICEKIKLFC